MMMIGTSFFFLRRAKSFGVSGSRGWTFEPDSRASFMIKTLRLAVPARPVSLPAFARRCTRVAPSAACVVLFVFVVEASFVTEKKLAPSARPGTRRLIQSTGLRASPPKDLALFGPKPPRR